MERAVTKGLMSPGEFHCRRAEMMESLASGVDDGTTRTSGTLVLAALSSSSHGLTPSLLSPVGVVGALREYYQSEKADCVHVWLSADTDHFCSSLGDTGWGCGYRNCQMLLSALLRLDAYAPVLQGNHLHPRPLTVIRVERVKVLLHQHHHFLFQRSRMPSSAIARCVLTCDVIVMSSSTRDDGAKHPSASEDD